MNKDKKIELMTQKWVNSFNSIPTALVKRAFSDDWGWEELQCLNQNPPADFPAWGWMWTFSDSVDEEWARENIQEIAQLSFEIFDSEETGLLLGIDGAGYDFYETHWIPLYKLRGLRWHEEEEE